VRVMNCWGAEERLVQIGSATSNAPTPPDAHNTTRINTHRYCHAPHAGSIVALCRSPFIEGLTLSVGDWCFQLWLWEAATPLFASPLAGEVYTAGGGGGGFGRVWGVK